MEKPIVELLMERDEISRKEAAELVSECRDAILEVAGGDGEYVDETDAIQEILGLEPDYLLEILEFKG